MDASYTIKNWPHHNTPQNISSARFPKGTKPTWPPCTFCTHPTCIFRIPRINGSRELPKTRVLTALTGACPTGNLQTHWISCAPEPAGSGHSGSSRLSQHSSCLPGGSPAWPRGTEAAQALPWTSVLENLEKQPVLLRGRVEEGEEQIIDRFW